MDSECDNGIHALLCWLLAVLQLPENCVILYLSKEPLYTLEGGSFVDTPDTSEINRLNYVQDNDGGNHSSHVNLFPKPSRDQRCEVAIKEDHMGLPEVCHFMAPAIASSKPTHKWSDMKLLDKTIL